VLEFALIGSAEHQRVPAESQRREYDAEGPKTSVELQQFRQTQSIRIKSDTGRDGAATLINLNPAVNAWYLLRVAWTDGTAEHAYHLENPAPQTRTLVLDEAYSSGLTLVEHHQRSPCNLFGAGSPDELEQGSSSQRIFYPLCESRVYLRNAATGHRTVLEAAAEFLRDRVWGGEAVINLGHHLLGDINRETGTIRTGAHSASHAQAEGRPGPAAALINATFADRLVTSHNLGISLEEADRTGLAPGVWYAARGNPGIYVSLLEPNAIAPEILQSRQTTVNNLDTVEASALVYAIAFDLDQFELGYAGGTTHPGVEWSEHLLDQMKHPSLPGPDGMGSIAPLITTGLVNPQEARRTVATFTGGFKRTHGAFRYGALALKNHGSHYGFIEQGVVLSKLQPGLATIVVLDDGSVRMKTWEEADNRLLGSITHARQNGVPIVEFDEVSQSTVPGPLVGRWGAGNWSGSETLELRTIRAGLALQHRAGKRFLIYAVFSAATPSAMARVFQAYQCRYAMLLDMNALEHTYLAIYRGSGSELTLDYLLKGMSQLDKSSAGQMVPRFVGYPDNRDFFYLMRPERTAVRP
jgi:hypothetical protein